MKQITIFILFAILLIGCSETVHFEFPQDEDLNIKIYSYDKNITVKECTVKSKTEKFYQIGKLLSDNSGEWSHEFASILPHTVVSNSKFYVTFSGQRMIVHRNKSQYSHIIQTNYHDFLNCDFKANKNEETQ
jgi:hypothetical protein